MPMVSQKVDGLNDPGIFIGPGDNSEYSHITRLKKMDDLDRLLSLMIHQIRNYCMSIKGYASLLNYEDGVSTKGRKWITNISRGICSLEDFLGEFENYRLTKKYLEEEFDASLLVRSAWRSAVELYGEELVNAHFELNMKEETKIAGDKNDFRKMVYQLFRNALEASEGEGTVKISIDGDKDSWMLEVQDDGCGMDEDELEMAGEILYSTKRAHIGCGLNLVAAVAARMDAEIEMLSEKNVGSIVRIKHNR